MRKHRPHVWLVLSLALAGLAGCGGSARATTSHAAGTTPTPTAIIAPLATATPTASYQPGTGFPDPATLGWVKSGALLPDAVAVAPGAPGTLYACTGAGATSPQNSQGVITALITLSVSTDGGATWQTKNTDIPLARCLGLAVSPANSAYLALFAGTCRADCGQGYNRLYVSLDAGAHWQQVSPSSDSDFSASFGWVGTTFFSTTVPDGTPASTTHFLAASRDGVHFTWTSLPAGPSQLLASGSTLFAVTGSSAPCTLSLGGCADIYRTADLGTSWSRLTPTYQGNNVRPLVLVPGGSTLIGFDARAFEGPNTYPTLRSTDGGASWQPLPGGPAGLQADTDAPSVTPDGTLFVTFCCGAPGVSGIYRLAPGASAWALVSPVVPAQIHFIAVSWNAQGHPVTLWGLRDTYPNTSASVTDLWSHPA